MCYDADVSGSLSNRDCVLANMQLRGHVCSPVHEAAQSADNPRSVLLWIMDSGKPFSPHPSASGLLLLFLFEIPPVP